MLHLIKRKLVILTILFSFLSPIAYASNTPSYASQYSEETAIMKVAQHSVPAVVSVMVSLNNQASSCADLSSSPEHLSTQQPSCVHEKFIEGGTGIIISSNGYILTDNHVVNFQDVHYTVLLDDGRSFDATVVTQDAQNDLAVLKINADNLPVLNFVSSSELGLGQGVVVIGNGLSYFHNSVSHGIISGFHRKVKISLPKIENGHVIGSFDQEIDNLIQTDALINLGNSGGPLLDLNGEVVGIVEADIPSPYGEGMGFAMPTENAIHIFDILKNKGIKIDSTFE